MKNYVRMSIGALLILCSVIAISSYTQTVNAHANNANDAEQLIAVLKKKLSTIKDFRVDLGITIELEYLNIPDTKAQYYYKAPNKSRIVSEGFGLLPKQGIGLPTNDIINVAHTAIISGYEDYEGKKLTKVKIIPTDESSDIILSTLWIEEKSLLIYKVTTSTRKGTLDMVFSYASPEQKYGLPRSTTVQFVLPQFALPKSLTGDLQKNNRVQKDMKKEVKGKAIVTYSNYSINKGLRDEVFNEKNNK
jgi:hypothetical protein